MRRREFLSAAAALFLGAKLLERVEVPAPAGELTSPFMDDLGEYMPAAYRVDDGGGVGWIDEGAYEALSRRGMVGHESAVPSTVAEIYDKISADILEGLRFEANEEWHEIRVASNRFGAFPVNIRRLWDRA